MDSNGLPLRRGVSALKHFVWLAPPIHVFRSVFWAYFDAWNRNVSFVRIG